MKNHILELAIMFAIALGIGIGAGVTITLLSGPTIHSTPVTISLNIDELVANYDADKAEREWQEQFGGMSDEERMFGIVGEPEIIE